jgi:CelD/BcsL family acetyltransferase involved in cellulose biosynthesis
MMPAKQQSTVLDPATTTPDSGVSKVRDHSRILDVDVIRDPVRLTALEHEWERLAAAATVPIFQSFDWISLWWKHFGVHAGRSLHVVTVRHDGVLVAILPLFEEREGLPGIIIRRRLRLMGAGVSNPGSYGLLSVYGPTDYLGAIVDPAFANEAAGLFASHIVRDCTDVDDLLLEHVPDGSFILSHLVPLLRDGGRPVRLEQTDGCPHLSLPPSMESFFASLGSNTRRRLTQARKAVGELFVIQNVSTATDFDPAYRDLIGLHQRRWNELGFAGLFSDRRFTAFHRELSLTFLTKGILVLKSAQAGGTCIAVRLLYFYNGGCFDYLSGFDDRAPASRRRPGMALLLDAMEEAIGKGFHTMDFLRGDEGYKFDFTNAVRWNSRVFVDLQRGRSFPVRSLSGASGLWRSVRHHLFQEWSLLKVQVRLQGVFRGVPSYFGFRLKRLQMKKPVKTLDNDVN